MPEKMLNGSQPSRSTVVRTERGLTVDGTRLTLYDIMDYLNQNWPADLIQFWFNLTDRQMEDILYYIREHREEVQAEYELVLQEAETTRQYWEERNRSIFEELNKMPIDPKKAALKAKIHERKARLGQR